MQINCKLVVTAQKNRTSFYAFCTILPQILPAVESLLSGFESGVGSGRLYLHAENV